MGYSMILVSRESVQASLAELPVSPQVLDALYDAGILDRQYVLDRVSSSDLSEEEAVFWRSKYRTPPEW